MLLGRKVGLSSSDIVLDGDPAPPPKIGSEPPIFGPCLLCRTAGWIKMPLGTKVGLDPGHIVLHGDPAHPQKGHPQISADVYCDLTVAHLSYC